MTIEKTARTGIQSGFKSLFKIIVKVSATGIAIRNHPYMSNVTYLKPRKKSDSVWRRKTLPSGKYSIGRSQPLKNDKHYQPLEGIASHTTFYGSTKVSIPARQPDRLDSDPARLEKISLDFEKAGDQPRAEFFANRYAYELLNPDRSLENVDHLLVDGDDLAVPPLGLSYASNCHKQPLKNRKKPAKRGSKGITTKQTDNVKEGCFLLEEEYGKNCLSFLTATLPAFCDRSELKLICLEWSDLIRKFVQALKRMLKERGYPVEMVWTTEIQEDRYRETGDVCPHLHLIMIGKKHRYQKGYAIHFSEVRALWERMLSNLLGRPVTCQAGTRVERPRKSLKAELGKYMSKGGKVVKEIIEDGKGDMLPSNYGGASDSLKAKIKAGTKIETGDEVLKFLDAQEDMKQAGLLFYVPIIIYAPNLGRDITVGFVGWIKDKAIVSEFLAA